MPTRVGPNTFGEENLVFGYDLGDAANSYRGEPTVNLAAGLGLTDLGAGLTYLGIEDGWKKYSMSGTWSGGGYPYSMALNGVTFTGGQPYSVVATLRTNVEHKFNYFCTDGISYVNQPKDYEGTLSATLNPDGSRTVRRVNFAYTGTTGQLGYLFTNPINGISFNSSTDFVWVKDYQAEQKTRPTPYIDGTRSNTQGLIDLKGNSTIDLANVSFDANAQMTFDGSNDLITLADAAHLKFSNGSFTVEQVLTVNSISSKQRTFSKGSSGWSRGWHAAIRPTQWEFELSDGVSSPGNGFLISTATTVGTNHVMWVVENGATVKLYVNGTQVGSTQTITEGVDFATTTSTVGIGAFESGGEYFNGKIPYTKLYSRALTAQEVRSNFNAIKGRFGI